jgi:glycosyltransferase involved in cell wall biosynthesis
LLKGRFCKEFATMKQHQLLEQIMKIAVITCYFDSDYVRARTLRAGVKAYPGARMIVIKNTHRSVLRYLEITWKLIQLRRTQKPDAYLLTFRGQEILPLVLLVAGLKPVIFDEFIVPIAYARGEQHRRSVSIAIKHTLARLSEPLYKWWLRQCRLILADTQAHAELSARVSQTNLSKYRVLPVGADEAIFKPTEIAKTELETRPYRVFFYGNMLPLHGIGTMLEAAVLLANQSDIEFLLVGGGNGVRKLAEQARERGAHLSYESWIVFDKLPAAIDASALCLGGPFGATPQAQHVITGKTYQFLACAAPTVVGASEVTDGLFIDKDNALVVPQADPEALAKAIQWGAKHRTELVEIGRSGRRLYERSFSSDVIATGVKKLLDELS